MKFSWKILFCTMLIMAAACGASGYFFVNYVFQTSMERETRQALDESSILRFAFETAALNIPSKYDVLPDGTVEQIGVYLENSGQHGNRLLRISDENGKVLYASEGFTGDTSLWEERGENTRVYRVVQSGDSYYIQTQTRINVSDRMLTLETMKNVTAVYTERTEGSSGYGDRIVMQWSGHDADCLLADQTYQTFNPCHRQNGGGRIQLSRGADQ